MNVLKKQRSIIKEAADLFGISIFRSSRGNRWKKDFTRFSPELIRPASGYSTPSDQKTNQVQFLKKQLLESIEAHRHSLSAFHKFKDCCRLAQSIASLHKLPDLLGSIKSKLDLCGVHLLLFSEEFQKYVPGSIPTLPLSEIKDLHQALDMEPGARSILGNLHTLRKKFPGIVRLIPDSKDQTTTGSAIIFPMHDKYKPERIIGFLSLHDQDEDRFSDEVATDFIDHFAEVFSWSLVSLRDHEKLLRENTSDYLTGCHNRNYLTKHAPRLLNFADRKKFSIALLFIDLDGFKMVNDSLGHQCGDLILIEVAHKIQNFVRRHDIFVRMGGDEFILLLPDTNDENASYIAQRIAREISLIDISLVCVKATGLCVSASVGKAMYKNGDSLDALINRADKNMYSVKTAKKN